MEKHRQNIEKVVEVLQANGFRVTKSRIQLLLLLEKAGTPLTIQKISKRWEGRVPNITTLYRSLTDLSAAGVVRRVDLNTGTAHFEYTPSRPHHHHLVCTGCGCIEEIEECSAGVLENKVIRQSAKFKKILTHNLEFFGECNNCIKV